MAKQTISIGTLANDGTGDPLRTAYTKANENFTENYDSIADLEQEVDDVNTAMLDKADLVAGKVPSSQLPSYVDDVVEYANFAALPATGAEGIIYFTLDDGNQYRWATTAYVNTSTGVGLGETSGTAYRGDRGATAFAHVSATNNPHSVTKAQVGLTNADDTADSAKPVSSAQQTALNLKRDNINTAVALTDAASMDLTASKQTLATSSAARTFTISYTGDDIIIEVTLSAISATYTFPATALCVSEGIATGNNIFGISGVSGDKYIIAVKKIGSAYYVVCKNFGQ